MPLVVGAGFAEELHLHLLELPRPKREVTRRYLVAERLTLLRYAERNTHTAGFHNIVEVHEHRLCSLRTQIHNVVAVVNRTDMRPEHQVEQSRLAQITSVFTFGTTVSLQQVCTEPLLAPVALHQRVGEAVHMPARNPDVWVHQNRRVNANDVIAIAHERLPPLILNVALQLNASRTVIVQAAQAAVYLAALEDEPPTLAETDDRVKWNVVQISLQFMPLGLRFALETRGMPPATRIL